MLKAAPPQNVLSKKIKIPLPSDKGTLLISSDDDLPAPFLAKVLGQTEAGDLAC